jgi:hypothetical protein
MTDAPPSDHRTVSETRFRFVMIVFAIVWTLQALLLMGLLYGVTVRVERLEYNRKLRLEPGAKASLIRSRDPLQRQESSCHM